MGRGRIVVGALTGIVWGVGLAIVLNQFGLIPLDPLFLYGIPLATAAISAGWVGAMGRRAMAVALLFVTGIGILAQQGVECGVIVVVPDEGETLLSETSPFDPLDLDLDPADEITVALFVSEPLDGAPAEVWTEVGGFRVRVAGGTLDGDAFIRDLSVDEAIEPFGGVPGIHHVGGSVEGVCSGEGYVRVPGAPWDNPIGLMAMSAVVLGLAGSWLVGRAARAVRAPAPPQAPPTPPPPVEAPPPPPPVGAPPPSPQTPPPAGAPPSSPQAPPPVDAAPPPVEAPPTAAEPPPPKPPPPVGEAPPTEAPRPVEPVTPRWLQARIFDVTEGDVPLRRGFRPGTEHRIEVRIGPEDAGWLQPAAEPFPDHLLPPERPSPLTVVLTEPDLLPRPLRAEIVLPPTGPSTRCHFTLTTRIDTRSVDARLIVLSGNRVLQTGRLPAAVEGVSDWEETEPSVETVVRPSTSGLADRPIFDAAFVVNHDAAGTRRVTTVGAGGEAIVNIDVPSINEAVSAIAGRLGEIVEQPEDFGSIDSVATAELLAFLAHKGRVLRSALVEDFLGEDLAARARLQVVSARPDAYFPFEFAYDFTAPREGATVCPHAEATLRLPGFEATCPGDHDDTTVCPFGFWGVSKVIERHAYQRGTDLPEAFLVRAQPLPGRETISLSGGALLAASSRVDAFAAGSIGHVLSALDAALGDSVQTETWDSWTDAVATRRPSTLVLMPHTVFSDTLSSFGLEIGSDDRRWAADIDSRFVPPEERPVIVALLGCATAVSGGSDWERFPGLFRRAGAEIVIGTLTEILGRHAAPVAERIVSLLHEATAAGPASFGEIMVMTRRHLLAEGVLAVLAVAAFGDADWILTA